MDYIFAEDYCFISSVMERVIIVLASFPFAHFLSANQTGKHTDDLL